MKVSEWIVFLCVVGVLVSAAAEKGRVFPRLIRRKHDVEVGHVHGILEVRDHRRSDLAQQHGVPPERAEPRVLLDDTVVPPLRHHLREHNSSK